MSALLRGLLRRGGYMAPENGGEGGSGGGGGGAQPPAPAPRDPETFSREYVTELRNENKGWRLKASEHEGAAKKAADDLVAANKAADDRVAAANKAADERVIRAELKAAALKAGMVDLDGLKLADLSKVKLNAETGEVEGADTMLEEMKKAKPYLFGSASSSSGNKPPPADPPSNKKATEMTDDEYAAARRALIGR